jgi:polyhydroxybutyrate depolymerase
MRTFGLKITIASSLIFAVPSFSHAQNLCGNEKGECSTSMGSYSIALPDRSASEGPIPALLYFHGAGGSGERTMRNRGMVDTFTKRGYAVIAPSGLKRPNSRFGPGWSFLPFRKKQRDELKFAHEVLADAAKRFSIDRDNIMMGGFSIGGSLTWYLACQDPAVAKAYVPVGGAFWRPHPVASDCKGAVNMMHTHGWRDGTVPLEGRPLRSGQILQGDVFVGMQIMRELNSCNQLRADKFQTKGAYWQRWWTKCAPDTALRFVLHPGGHGVPKGWGDLAIDWFEALESGKTSN